MNMPVEQIRVSPNAADYGQIARKLHADNVDTLLSILNPNQLVAIVSALVAAGSPRPLVISTAGYSQSALQSFGSQLEGTYFSALTRPFEAPNPALDEYRSAVAAYAPYLQDAEQTVGVMGWISADMFVQGLRRAGTCPTRSSFLTALRGISAYDADGLLARPVNLASLTPSIDQCYFLVRVATGHFVAAQQPVACGQALGG
jgi:ABC-type branched-subunit amino acid transport system substrate-binding protein